MSEPIANAGGNRIVLSFRVLDLSRQDAILDSQQLTIDGTRASLGLSGKASMMPADGGPVCTQVGSAPEECKPMTTIGMWREEVSATMTGTAQRRDTGFAFDFARADPHSPHLVMSCTEQWLDIAPAKAVVVGANDCTPLKWSLPTERVKVLVCTTRDDATPFAASPGLEEVVPPYPDCGGDDRPHMYRRIGADGSVAQALAR